MPLHSRWECWLVGQVKMAYCVLTEEEKKYHTVRNKSYKWISNCDV